MKIRFNSNDDLPLKRALELYNIMKIVRPIFHDGSKYYPQIT